MPEPTDATLLRAAIDATGLPDQAFAVRVLNAADGSGVRAVLAGRRGLDRLARRVCAAIVRAPVVAELLAGVDFTPGVKG